MIGRYRWDAEAGLFVSVKHGRFYKFHSVSDQELLGASEAGQIPNWLEA